MRATIDRKGQRAAESLNSEAEVEAWRRKRTRRPVSMTGKVAVVRVHRRERLALLSGPSADRAFAATAG